MERLTIRLNEVDRRCAKISTNLCCEYNDCFNCPQYKRMVSRLAAYEDTGMEPEEIEDFASVREITPEAEYAINKHADSLIERMDALLHQDDSELESIWVCDRRYLQRTTCHHFRKPREACKMA